MGNGAVKTLAADVSRSSNNVGSVNGGGVSGCGAGSDGGDEVDFEQELSKIIFNSSRSSASALCDLSAEFPSPTLPRPRLTLPRSRLVLSPPPSQPPLLVTISFRTGAVLGSSEPHKRLRGHTRRHGVVLKDADRPEGQQLNRWVRSTTQQVEKRQGTP